MLCTIAAVTIWAILPRWVDLWSVDTTRPAQAWVSVQGPLRITAQRVAGGVGRPITVRLTAAETGLSDPTAARPFRFTTKLHRSDTLRFPTLAAGDYSVKVIPAQGSRWLVTAQEHRSWGGLPW